MVSKKFRAIACCLIACLLPACFTTSAHAEETHKPNSLTVLNYLTGWQLDAIGYHPALFMLVENTSGRDLTGTLIRLQGRFTDLQTAEVTIGRTELRRDLKPHQQFPVSIASSAAFELPYQVDMWPRIEAKVLCRVGTVNDEGTETLLLAKIDQEARSEDAAFEHLNTATSFAPKGQQAAGANAIRRRPDPLPEKPLVAKASRRTQESAAHGGDNKLFLFSEKTLPGIGDNFYQFELRFGMPRETDALHGQWTWARYLDATSGSDIIAGSHDGRGNVDVLIVKTPPTNDLNVMRLTATARALSGKLHSQPLSAAAKSVRYLASGRMEVITASAPGYRVTCVQGPADTDNSLFLILCRSPQDAEQLLATQVAKVPLLKTVQFFAGRQEAQQK